MPISNRTKSISYLLFACVLNVITSCDISNPWQPGDPDPIIQTKILRIDVRPDTAIMGVDTVYAKAFIRDSLSTEYDFKYYWTSGWILPEDSGKTEREMRFFIPNDTTEDLPADIQGVNSILVVQDTSRIGENASDVFTILLKRPTNAH